MSHMFVSSGLGRNSRPRVGMIVSGQAVAAVLAIIALPIVAIPLLPIMGLMWLGGADYGPPMAIAFFPLLLVAIFAHAIWKRAQR
jgi:hypothetical protein